MSELGELGQLGEKIRVSEHAGKSAGGGTRLGWLSGLDGLRALAVGAVVVYHFRPDVLPGGFLGVDLFFVISGYLITRLLLAEIDDRGRLSFAGFYLRRVRRLLPAACALIGVVALSAVFFWRDELPMMRGGVPAALGYVSNWWLIGDHQSYFVASGRPSMLQHLWSLAIEEQFYLVWPFVLTLVIGAFVWRRRVTVLTNWRLIALAATSVALAAASTAAMAVISIHADIPYGADSGRVYFGTDTHSMGLLLGAAAGALAVRARFSIPRPVLRGAFLSDIAALAALVGLGLTMARLDEFDPWLYRGGFLGVSALCVVAVAAVPRHGSAVGWVLDRAPLRWVGRRSYAIYLWHWPIAVVTRPGLDIDAPGVVVLGVRVLLTLVLADLSYRLVERPVRRDGLAGLTRAWHLERFSTGVHPRLAPLGLVGTLAVIATLASGLVPRLLPAEASPVSAMLQFSPSQQAPFDQAALGGPESAPAPRVPTSGATYAQMPSRDRHPSLAPTPTASAVAEPAAEPAAAPPPAAVPVSAFGDSVMLGASPALAAVLPKVDVDAVEGRQARVVFTDIAARRAAGTLAPTVVIHTGDNGVISPGDLATLLDSLSDRRRVVVLTDRVPRDWQDPNNRTLADVVARYHNAVLLDWYGRSAGHDDWLYGDGLHLRPPGAQAYAAMVAAAVN
jgi:peptidoglycan/LPS O-acetylase OafA/YrhL